MSFIERLAPLRNQPATRLTSGLDDATLTALSANHPQLIAAVDAAAEEFARVQADDENALSGEVVRRVDVDVVVRVHLDAAELAREVRVARIPVMPVGDDEQTVRQVFGQDAVLGRRIGGRTQPDHRISCQRIESEEHHGTAEHLDSVADEHDAPLGIESAKAPTKAASST